MVTREMLHAEIDRLTDEEADTVYRLVRSVSTHGGADESLLRASTAEAEASAAWECAAGRTGCASTPPVATPDTGLANMDGVSQEKGILSALLDIQIDAPEDFAENIDLYASGEKRTRDVH